MKRITSVFLTLVMMLSLLTIGTVTTNAATTQTFTDENGISWTVTECYPGWAIKAANKNQISGTVTIPSTYNGKVIQVIDSGAFYGCNNLDSVIIGENIVKLEQGAFTGSGLKSITIPNSVKMMGRNCFSSCNNLTSITWNNLNEIPAYSFDSCAGLKEFTIPEGIVKIGDGAFINSGIETINISSSVKEIGREAFFNTPLKSISIPDNVNILGENLFRFCSSLKNFSIGSGITILPKECFYACTSLRNINLSNTNIEIIGDSCFLGCGVTSISLPTSLKRIEQLAFWSNSLSYLSFPNGLEYIGTGAFNQNRLRGSFVFPESVSYIGSRAFIPAFSEDIARMTSVIISNPNCIVEKDAFPAKFGYPVSSSYIGSEVMTDLNGYEWYVTKYSNNTCRIRPLNQTLELRDVVIPETIGSYTVTAFDGFENTNIETVVMPNSIVEISNNAFKNCTSLYSITLSSNLKTIGDSAFYGCSSLNNVELPSKLQTIGYQAFQGCTSWTSELVIPDSIKKVGQMAFYSCKNEVITINNCKASFGSSCFIDGFGSEYLSENRRRVNISSLANYLKNEFVSYPGLFSNSDIYINNELKTSIVIPEGISIIPNCAFENASITSISIPDSCVEIGNNAFTSSKLNNIIGGKNVKKIGKEAFEYSNISHLLPEVEEIGEYAYYSCNNLTGKLIVPDSVKIIEKNAFSYCQNISDIELTSETRTSANCFGNMGNINTLVLGSNKLSNIDASTFYNTHIESTILNNESMEIDTPFLSGGQIEGNLSLGEDAAITNEYAFYGNDNMSITTVKSNRNVIMYAKRNAIPLTVVDSITESGSSKDAIVTLTTDKANLRVTVPTVLPVSVDSDNNITVANNAQIVNSSRGQIDITNAVLSGSNTWELSAFNTDFTKSPVDIKQYGFQLLGYNVPVSGNAFNNQFDTIDGNSALDLTYDANVAIQSEAIDAAEIGNIVFTVAWHK